MKSQSAPQPNPFEACQAAAARAFQAVGTVRGSRLSSGSLSKEDLAKLEASMTAAGKAAQEHLKAEALEHWEQAADLAAKILEQGRASLSGRLGISQDLVRQAKQDAKQARQERARWLQSQKKRSSKQAPKLFDAAFYESQLPAGITADQGPWEHYANQGWKEGRDPHPLFSSSWYLRQNADVAESGTEPFQHYLNQGWKEGRAPHPWFDPRWYLRRNPDVADTACDPLEHYTLHGWKEKRLPNALFALEWYLAEHLEVSAAGVEPLGHFLSSGWKTGTKPHPDFDIATQLHWNSMEDQAGSPTLPQQLAQSPGTLTDASAVVSDHFSRQCDALRVFPSPGVERRMNVVVDRLAADSSADAITPAVILGVLLAEKLNLALRIITRSEAAKPGALLEILSANQVTCHRNVQFAFASVNRDSDGIDVSDQDFFITTSWATTWSVTQSITKKKVMWLVQDDERTLLPEGDAKLRCQQMLADDELFLLVSTQLLHQHLVRNGVAHVEKGGAWFEPAFPSPSATTSLHPLHEPGKRMFVFHATPQDSRTLPGLGLEVIDAAIAEGLLPHDTWKLIFVGAGLRPMVMVDGIHPVISRSASPSQIEMLLKSTDLCFAPLLTPQAGSMTLRAAAAGAAVVSTTFGDKRSLTEVSQNILCAAPDKRTLLEILRSAVALAGDAKAREQHRASDHLLRDWSVSFATTLDTVAGRFGLNS